MDGQDYLIKLGIHKELDKIIDKSNKLFEEDKGRVCQICKVIQGEPLKGFKVYYCKHFTQRIDARLSKWKEKVVNKIFMSIAYKKLKEEKNKSTC